MKTCKEELLKKRRRDGGSDRARKSFLSKREGVVEEVMWGEGEKQMYDSPQKQSDYCYVVYVCIVINTNIYLLSGHDSYLHPLHSGAKNHLVSGSSIVFSLSQSRRLLKILCPNVSTPLQASSSG